MARQPHILVLLTDQMQHDRMGFVDGVAQTPALDALAAEGVHFRNAFTVQAQCTPSRAAFQTGRYAHETGVMVIKGFHGHQCCLKPTYPTIGKHLRDGGYETAYFGKMHLFVDPGEIGYDTHFCPGHEPLDAADVRRLGIGHVPDFLKPNYLSAEKAVDYLRQWTPGERPLFFTFSTDLPHPPFFLEKDYTAGLPDPQSLALPRSFGADSFEGKPRFQAEHLQDGHGLTDPDHLRRMMYEYYTMIAAADAHIGRVIAEFKRLGIWDDTLVVFTADHGDMMGAHNMKQKGTLPYDELYHVPLIVKPHRGLSTLRKVIDDLAPSVGVAGMLAEAAGLPAEDLSRHGDLWETLTADQPPIPRDEQRVYFEHYAAYWGTHPFYGIRTHRYKLVRYYGDDNCLEMYDLQHDPDELHNIADDAAYQQDRDALLAEIDQWWRRTDGRSASYYESDLFREFTNVQR